VEVPEIPKHGHPRRSIYVPGGIYFVTTVVQGRTAFFGDCKLLHIFLKSLVEVAVLKDFRVLALALMPDHVHLVVRIGKFNTSKIMHSLKKHVSREINKRPDIDIFRWQQSFRDQLIRGKKDFASYFYYTVGNPSRHETDGFAWSVATHPGEAIEVNGNGDFEKRIRRLLEKKLGYRKNSPANTALIAAVENEINEQVYAFFGLTEREIASLKEPDAESCGAHSPRVAPHELATGAEV
jgi:putative transposase